MNNRIINSALVIGVIAILVLLAFRVSFEKPSDSEGCCVRKDGCTVSYSQAVKTRR